MERVWQVDKLTRLRSTLSKLGEEKTAAWSLDTDFAIYLKEWRRMNASTIRKRILQLKSMARHPVVPLKLDGSREEVVNSFSMHVTYREQMERAGAGALINAHKAIRSLGDFLSIPREVWPTMPAQPAHTDIELPSPEDVYALLHTDYLPNAKRNYENALIRYLLAFDFGFGVRFPSEAFAARLADVNIERRTLVVTEPKKSGRRRTVYIEPAFLANSHRHMSLEQWLKWRERVAGCDALFPREDGTPFPTKDALRARLCKVVTPRFPWFNPYLGRHWSVNARLIEWEYDFTRVSQWHGHESVNMTKNAYEHSARLYSKIHGNEWIRRAFEKPRCTAQGPSMA